MKPPTDPSALRQLLRRFLEEDLGSGDVTTLAIVPDEQKAAGRFVAKSLLVLAGIEIAVEALRLLDERLEFGEAGHFHFELPSLNPDALRGANGRANAARDSGVVVFDQDRVAQAHAVIHTAADRNGIFFERAKARRRFSRVKNFHSRTLDRLHKSFRERCDPAEPLQEIQANPLPAEQGASLAARARRLLARLEAIPVAVAKLGLEETLKYDIDAVLLDNMKPEVVRQAVGLVRSRPGGAKIRIEASSSARRNSE